jgi:hypothetical protein
MNKLIKGLSKKAADINIELNDILNKNSMPIFMHPFII